MKYLRPILYTLVILGTLGLLIWQGLIQKNLETVNLIKGILLIAASVVGILNPSSLRKNSHRKITYMKVYGDFLQNAFADNTRLQRKLYAALDDYNDNRHAAAIKKLTALRGQCQRSADVYAVTVFTALCHDDMNAWSDAIIHYQAALSIRDHSTLHSNMGLCLMRLNRFEEAEAALQRAIRSDETNAAAWCNLASLHLRQGDYEGALQYARQAIDISPKLPQALSFAAICCGLLGDHEQYEHYYRQAVANGYDGQTIKNTVNALDPKL